MGLPAIQCNTVNAALSFVQLSAVNILDVAVAPAASAVPAAFRALTTSPTLPPQPAAIAPITRKAATKAAMLHTVVLTTLAVSIGGIRAYRGLMQSGSESRRSGSCRTL